MESLDTAPWHDRTRAVAQCLGYLSCIAVAVVVVDADRTGATLAASRSVFHPATSEGRKEPPAACRSLPIILPLCLIGGAPVPVRPPVGIPNRHLPKLLRTSGSDFGPPLLLSHPLPFVHERAGRCVVVPPPASYNSISCWSRKMMMLCLL